MAKDFDPNIGKATQFRSGDEAAKNGQKGGIASGEARRERKAITEICKEIDDMPLDSKTIKEIAQQLGAPEEWVAQMTHRTAKAFSVNKQILMKGSVKDWVEWLKVAGDYVETFRHEGTTPSGELLLAPKEENAD